MNPFYAILFQSLHLPDIAVVDVVGMFPDINTKDGNQTSSGLEGVLVGTRSNFKTTCAGVVSEPTPATALDSYNRKIGRYVGN